MSFEIASHICISEPKLAFHPDRISDQDIHPLRGLLRYGPYTGGVIPDPIRIATLAPNGTSQKVYDFLKDLKTSFAASERKDYLPNWPSFQRVFGIHVRAAGGNCHMELDATLDKQLAESHQSPHIVLADNLARAISRLDAFRVEFDVLVIYIPNSWEHCYTGGPLDDFDLHDFLKATLASKGIPVQLIREDKAVEYPDRASVMWRVALAIYTKAGGIPWKLAESSFETAVIGISYAVRNVDSGQPRFVTCCSQVFDSDGAGLEFIAYDAHEVSVHRKNPFLSQTEMFRVMTRSLDLYRRRHAGRSPRRVMVHKTTEFQKQEVDGCMEALHLCEDVDLIQIVADVGWRGIRIDRATDGKKGKPAAYPVSRGSLITTSPREALLWTHGDVNGISEQGKPYFKGAKSTPQPLRLVRHAGHGPWEESATTILALTKMNWNNDGLYDILPVTIGYAQVLARVLKRMPNIPNAPYQFRFFM